MNNLNIDYNSELTIKQGEHCGVKYYGDNDVKVYRTKDTLYIKEHKSDKRGYSVNINPFNQSKSKLKLHFQIKTLII